MTYEVAIAVTIASSIYLWFKVAESLSDEDHFAMRLLGLGMAMWISVGALGFGASVADNTAGAPADYAAILDSLFFASMMGAVLVSAWFTIYFILKGFTWISNYVASRRMSKSKLAFVKSQQGGGP